MGIMADEKKSLPRNDANFIYPALKHEVRENTACAKIPSTTLT